MIKKIIVYLRPIKLLIRLFFYSPKYFYKKIITDLEKEAFSKKLKKNFHIVWCAGLAKSGTTLIEEILRELPMLQINNSVLRIYDDTNLDHIHGITDKMFSKFPKNKLSFLKTHSHYNKHYTDIANKYNSKIIISMRDIRDVMISRYFHAKSDKAFFKYNLLNDLSFKEGFIMSLKESLMLKYDPADWKLGTGETFQIPLQYYYRWILDWQNYAKKNSNCLILWFEDFIADPKNYIKKITNYLEFEDFEINKMLLKLESNRGLLKKRNLVDNLNQFQPQTFRKGESEGWKKVLDDEILKEFYSILPDDINKIEYKRNN